MEFQCAYYVLHINRNFPTYLVRAMNGNMYRIESWGRQTTTQPHLNNIDHSITTPSHTYTYVPTLYFTFHALTMAIEMAN